MVFDKIKEIIIDQLSVDESMVTADTNYLLGVGSLCLR